MLRTGSHVDHRVALGIESDRSGVRPVARLAGPARRMALAGFFVKRMASYQDGLVAALVALLRADIADATVPVIDVGLRKGQALDGR